MCTCVTCIWVHVYTMIVNSVKTKKKNILNSSFCFSNAGVGVCKLVFDSVY